MDERVYWLWLQHALGVGAAESEPLLYAYGNAKAVYEAATVSPDIPLKPGQRKALKDKDLTEAAALLRETEDLGAWVMTPDDEEYAALFGGMYAPPVVLYGKGERIDVSDAPAVAVVGTRKCDENGIVVTRRLAAGLAAAGAIVVTGGAEGLDSQALIGALDEGGRCISFQACGIDVEYPRSVAPLRKRLLQSGGMLLTEFPLGLPAHRHHFRIRNRLISAAARGTLVTQAPYPSGAVMTANWAREQGRDVFAVPGTVGVACCEGSNALLKEGAKLVTNTADVLIEYIDCYAVPLNFEAAAAAEDRAAKRRWHERLDEKNMLAPPPQEEAPAKTVLKVAEAPKEVTYAPCPAAATPDMKQVYEALSGEGKTAAELAKATALPLHAVLAALTKLEIYKAVSCEAGQRYVLRVTP